MIIRRFLLWARTASACDRAIGVSSLIESYLHADLSADDRWEAETAMTAMLDDPSSLVRRILAEGFADSQQAPRHLIVALASDQSDIAAIVLSRSPILSEYDLIDCAALGDDLIQTAIAMRASPTVAVAAALAEIAGPDPLIALIDNPGAQITPTSFVRMIERHGDIPELREALLQRADLPVDIRQMIAVKLARQLSLFVRECGWLSLERSERVTREAQEKTTLALSASVEIHDVRRLVAHLRRTAQLTPALILRAVLSRGMAFAEAAFADLTGLPPSRVAGLIHDRRGAGFAALYKKAGLPATLQPAFEAAMSALREQAKGETGLAGAQLSRRMIERVLTACTHLPAEEAGKLMALLRRYEMEAAREEARGLAQALADDAALAVVLEHAPQTLLEDRSWPLAA